MLELYDTTKALGLSKTMLGKYGERKSKQVWNFYCQLPFYGLLLQPKECHIGAIRTKELQNPVVALLRLISAPSFPKNKTYN